MSLDIAMLVLELLREFGPDIAPLILIGVFFEAVYRLRFEEVATVIKGVDWDRLREEVLKVAECELYSSSLMIIVKHCERYVKDRINEYMNKHALNPLASTHRNIPSSVVLQLMLNFVKQFFDRIYGGNVRPPEEFRRDILEAYRAIVHNVEYADYIVKNVRMVYKIRRVFWLVLIGLSLIIVLLRPFAWLQPLTAIVIMAIIVLMLVPLVSALSIKGLHLERLSLLLSRYTRGVYTERDLVHEIMKGFDYGERR